MTRITCRDSGYHPLPGLEDTVPLGFQGSFLPIDAHVILPPALGKVRKRNHCGGPIPRAEKVWLLLETIPSGGGEHTQKLTHEGLVKGSQPTPFDQM